MRAIFTEILVHKNLFNAVVYGSSEAHIIMHNLKTQLESTEILEIGFFRLHCKYQCYILTRCSVNLLVVFNTMVLKRVFFVIINTCVALI